MDKLGRLFVVAWTVLVGSTLSFIAPAANAACPQVGFTVVEPHASLATRPVRIGKDQTIFVRRVPITTTSDIIKIRLVRELAGESNDGADLLIKFTPAADQRLHEATTNHSGRRIAFMFNDAVLINVVWEGPYGFDPGGVRVSMNHGLKQGQQLMKAIRGCTGAPAGDEKP